jgi:hypothetical protein
LPPDHLPEIARGPLWILLLALLSPAALAQEPSPEGQAGKTPARTRTGFEEPCRRCGATGRIVCATCGGVGSLRKTCPICQGKGRKPCPQCTVPGPGGAKASVPGKVLCTACAGKGTLDSAPDRPCFKCRGARELPCPVCFGKGDLSCPKTRYDKTCPTCSFVGTVLCPDCNGTGNAPPSDPGAESSEKKGNVPADDLPLGEPAAAETVSAEPEKPASPAARAKGYTSKEYEADHLALASLWEDFDKQFRELAPVFEADTTIEEIRRTRSDAGRLSRSFAEDEEDGRAVPGDLSRKVRDAQKELNEIERSWGGASDRYQGLAASYRRARVLWEGQPQWTLGLSGEDREALRDKLGSMRKLFAAGQKAAAGLRDDKPGALAQRSKSVRSQVEGLRRAFEKLKAATLAAPPATRPAPNGVHADPAVESDRAGAGPAAPAAATLVGSGAGREPLARGPSGAAPSALTRKSGSSGSAAGRAASAAQVSPSSAGSNALAVILGFLAVGICSAGYYVLHRRM